MEPKLKRKAVEGSCASKKKSRVEEEDPVVAKMRDVYKSRGFLERITECLRKKEMLTDDIAGVVVYNQPFQLCVLPQFIISDKMDFLRQLTNEILRLKFVEKNNDLYQFRQKFGILDHGEAPSNFMTFYTSLASLSQVAIRLEDAVSMWSTMSVSSTATNNTSDSNCTASNNCATTGNNSNATNTDSSVPTDDNSNSSTTGYNSIGNSSSYAYEWLEIQALSAVVGQVVADACNYSGDLKDFKSPCITAFRHLLLNECLLWLRQVMGLELNDYIDITCSKYEFTDYLLCHDDQLEGRIVAFIFYLIPDWTPQDGGNLELFDTNDVGEPGRVVVSIHPVWNNFIFFEVTRNSFHQVSEVVNAMKTRLSISGWFHGPRAHISKPPPLLRPAAPLMSDPTPADLSTLSNWVNPFYLDIGTHSQVQPQFEVDSQIELSDFLLEEKYDMLCDELESQHCKWIVKGPPNKRHVHVAVQQSIPPAMTAFLEFLHSEPFCCLLSHLTGLDLAENVIRTNMTEEKWEEPCSSTNNECQVNDRRDSGGDGNEVKQTEEPQVAEIKKDGHTQEQQGISRSILSTQLNCSLSDDDTSTTRCNDLCTSANSSSVDHHVAVAKVRGELLYFWPGDYTLVSDQDPSIGQCELHLHLHFCCDDWSVDCGGTRVYVAKDEDEELLSVSPSRNALSLVYCDQDTLSFTKYINHRSNCTDSYIITAFTYREKYLPS